MAQAAERTERGGRRAGVTIRESDEHQSEGEDMDLEEQIFEQQEQPLRRSSRVQAQAAQSSQAAASPSQPQR